MAKNVLSDPGRALDLTAKIATAAATKSPKAALLSLPDVINFHHTGRGLNLEKFVQSVPFIWKRKQIDYTHLHH